MPVALEFIGTAQNIAALGAPGGFFFTAKLKSLNSCRGGIKHCFFSKVMLKNTSRE